MGKRSRAVAVLAAAVVLVLVLAQLLLPGIAARRIRSRLSAYGSVDSVSVKAWPALELLWRHADSVTVKAGALRLTPAQTAKLLWEARGMSEIHLSAASVSEGGVQLHDVSFHKHGKSLSGQGRMTEQDVKAALPPGLDVRLISGAGGEIKVKASGGLFGVHGSLDAVAGASEGKLIARPLGFPPGALALTLFSQPHVYIVGVGARPLRDPEGALSYELTIAASLR